MINSGFRKMRERKYTEKREMEGGERIWLFLFMFIAVVFAHIILISDIIFKSK